MSRIQRNHRRGNYAAFFGVSAIVLLGFAAIGVDSGWHRVALAQLGNGADAAAHAGAIQLDGTQTGIDNALARALAVGTANTVHGDAIVLDSTDPPNNPNIIMGRFDAFEENGCTLIDGCWSALGDPVLINNYDPPLVGVGDVDVSTVNAVRVQAGQEVSVFFGGFPFGRSTLGAAKQATARLPIYVGEDCAFPISLGQCSIEEFMGNDPCGKFIRLRFSNSGVDNAAWSTPEDDRGAATMREMLSDESGCTGAVANDDFGNDSDAMWLNNGQVNSANMRLGQIIDPSSPNYAGVQGWDTNWSGGAPCPVLSSTTCNTATQGICSDGVNNSQATCTGTWTDTCPTTTPDCVNGHFMRRQIAVFDLAEAGMSCLSNGNIVTGGSANFTGAITPTGFASMVIYDVGDTGSGKYIDAYITCYDENGDLYDFDGDPSNYEAIHPGDDTYLDPDDMTVAIVQ
ncbi:MAG: hypothetical protein EP330_12095 [Deltaproteobacteria bacterium]|nr:MAG: hypothetical protein EP330_12095 [Deltaproteobacteria bacterium]